MEKFVYMCSVTTKQKSKFAFQIYYELDKCITVTMHFIV